MVERNGVTIFARRIAEGAAIAAAAGLAVMSSVGPVRHVIVAQADPWIAILAVLAISSLVGASVAAIAGACPDGPTEGG